MIDYTNKEKGLKSAVQSKAVEYDQGLRAHMLKVYNTMSMGLGITGLVAYFASTSEALMQAIFGTPLAWVVIFAPLAFVIYFSARINVMSESKAKAVFYIYAAVMGLSLSTVFLMYTGASVARTFFITAATFGALSLYGYTTKKDLTGWGSFLFMGLIGIIIASVVNIFLGSAGLGFVISVAGVLIFTGLTAYDSQKIKQLYYVIDGGNLGKAAIMGALTLYLDFINLFLMLLRLMGDRR